MIGDRNSSRVCILAMFVQCAALAVSGCGGGGAGNPAAPSPSPAPAPTAPTNYSLAVPYESQLTDSWCWAASEQMVLQGYGFQYSQADIVAATYGQVVDMPGTAQQIQAGLNYLSRGRIVPQIYSGAMSLAQVKGYISKGHPIIIQYESPYLNEGHFVVLFGYGANGDVMIDDPVFGQFDVPYSTTFTYNSAAGPLVWFLSIIA